MAFSPGDEVWLGKSARAVKWEVIRAVGDKVVIETVTGRGSQRRTVSADDLTLFRTAADARAGVYPPPKPKVSAVIVRQATSDEALLALERRVLNDTAVLGFRTAVADLRLALANESPDMLAKLLAITPPDVTLLLQSAIHEAHDIGTLDAIDSLGDHELTAAQRERLLASRPSEALLARAQRLSTDMADDLAKAKLLATAGADLTAAASPALAAGNRLANGITYNVVEAGNRSIREVADIAELPTVWVAETDACVHCLAYSGRVCQPGALFPGGLTYGAKSYYPDPLPTPPLHGRCRCRLELLRDATFADALRREADRSVLRGFSLPSESMSVRVGAAQRLINNGVSAPKSVLAYSRRAIKAGAFPNRGRP